MTSAANGGGGDDAGVHLAINHFRNAALGDVVLSRAIPVHLGRSTQAWEVKLWKMDPSEEGKKGLQIAESRVTLSATCPCRTTHTTPGAPSRSTLPQEQQPPPLANCN